MADQRVSISGHDYVWLAVGTLLCSLAISPRAHAQLLDTYYTQPEPTSGERTADDSRNLALNRYSSDGIRAGSFIIRPNLTSGFGYNSNVDGYAGGKGSSMISTNGSVRVNSDWGRDSLFVFGTVSDVRYLDLASQSFTTWSVGAGGTIDVGRDKIGLAYSHQNLNLIPGNLGAVTVLQPVSYQVDNGTLNYTLTTGSRFSFVPEISVTNYTYNNFTAGGQTVSESYQNRLATQGSLTTRYEIAPQQNALLVVRGTNLAYRSDGGLGVPKRDANVFAVLGGLDYPAPGSNFRFRVLAGYQTRQFSNSAYKTISAPIVEASIIYTPTRLTTVTLAARRDIEDASDPSIAAYTLTDVKLSVDHELRRNITLNGFLEFQQANYQNSSFGNAVAGINTVTNGLSASTTTFLAEAGTTQSIYSAGGQANWLVNRNIRAGASFEVSQHTGGGTTSFTSYLGLLTLGFHL